MAKDALNRKKHGLTLADGVAVLEDPDSDEWVDDRFDYGEERTITLGLSSHGVLYVSQHKPMRKLSGSSPSGKRNRTKSKGMVWVEHNPGDPPIETDTDWVALSALTEEQLSAAALSDPDTLPIPPGTEDELAKIGLKRIVNPKRLRERLGLTQEEFATRYHIPVGTLRDWEQRRKRPDAPARAYLTVIARDPHVVANLLGEAA